eukprot:6191878-Pleurochrysis_carterae.AAC.4
MKFNRQKIVKTVVRMLCYVSIALVATLSPSPDRSGVAVASSAVVLRVRRARHGGLTRAACTFTLHK